MHKTNKYIILFIVISFLFSLTSCTQNSRDKFFGIKRYETVREMDGNKFLLKYQIDSYGVTVNYFINDSKKELTKASFNGDLHTGLPNTKYELVKLYKNDNTLIYRSYNIILYIINNNWSSYSYSTVFELNIDTIESPQKKEEMITVTEALLSTDIWESLMYFGEYKLEKKDTEFSERIKSYSKNVFTEEELTNNTDSEIERYDFVEWAKSMVEKYEIS